MNLEYFSWLSYQYTHSKQFTDKTVTRSEQNIKAPIARSIPMLKDRFPMIPTSKS